MRSIVRLVLLACLATLLIVGSAGCAAEDDSLVPDPVVPADPDLSTPEGAVRSYLDWVSFAYRMANSQIPTQTITGYEYVRVDAYIEMNRQDGVGLDQELIGFEVRDVNEGDESATVAAFEEWRFRYFSLDSLRYTTPERQVRYETTYTVVFQDDEWLVDAVRADPLDPLE